LPMAFLLTIPAGAGLAAVRANRRWLPVAAGVGAMSLSLAVPSGDLARTEKASALAVVSDVQRKSGELAAAATTARLATELDPANAVAWFNRGVIDGVRGDTAAAERAYRAALNADPSQPDAAANLAGMLVATGRAADAVGPLERVLAVWPRHSVAWTNLVVAYAAAGDLERARSAAKRAAAAGVVLDPDLVKAVRGDEGR
jgi:protein O-GlcNAc transferase